MVKNPPGSAGDMGSIPGSGRSLGKGNGNPLQYSCLENPLSRGARQTIVHGVTKSQTQLSVRAHTHTHTHIKYRLYYLLMVSSGMRGASIEY